MASNDRRRLNLIDVAVHVVTTPIGPLVYAVAGTSVIGVEFGKDLSKSSKKHLDVYGGPFRFGKPAKNGRYDAAFKKYFDGDMKAFVGVPFASHGSDFQRQVWRELLKVPAGKTATYNEIAKAIGDSKASRAVGLANNCNPVGIIVPCHRIIGANGKLTGYAGGIGKKKWLLEHELAATSKPVAASKTPAAGVKAGPTVTAVKSAGATAKPAKAKKSAK